MSVWVLLVQHCKSWEVRFDVDAQIIWHRSGTAGPKYRPTDHLAPQWHSWTQIQPHSTSQVQTVRSEPSLQAGRQFVVHLPLIDGGETSASSPQVQTPVGFSPGTLYLRFRKSY